MATEFSEVRRNISLFFMSLRQSIERPFRLHAPVSEDERERFTRSMMLVEEARIRFNSYTRYREEPSATDWRAARRELLSFVDTFLSADHIDRSLYERRFILTTLTSRDRENPTSFMKQFMSGEARGQSIADAIVAFRSFVEDSDLRFATNQGSLSFEELGRIVPRQQVAPIQFDIVNGRIAVVRQAPKTLDADRANIQSALEHIKGSGERLIKNLEQSNCDRRLLESVQELQSQLLSEGNIVKIGLTNMACGVMGATFQAELPDAVSAMFHSYSSSVSLYVAQFPEWEQFTQKAYAIELDEDDVAEIDASVGAVIDELAASPYLADPEVPKTIAFVRRFLTVPGASGKRAAFAMIRTIENLVSSIIRHSLAFVAKTAEKTVDAASTAASKVIVGLLGIALMSASGVGPAAVRAGAPWVKQAAEIVQKQIEKMAE